MNRLCTLCFLVLMCGTGFAQELAVAPFVGEWVNKDPDTRGITRVSLKMTDTGAMAQMWGKCHPSDCDWGQAVATPNPADADGPSVKVIWEHGFKAVIQTLRIDNDGQLHVSSLTHYTDKSGRRDRIEQEIFIPAPKAAK
ncbi:MAG: hypothetical protein R3F13_21445 [Prosthecobacter sp.]